jgi:hypothetical protein
VAKHTHSYIKHPWVRDALSKQIRFYRRCDRRCVASDQYAEIHKSFKYNIEGATEMAMNWELAERHRDAGLVWTGTDWG